jgi:hypothetical protein
MINLSKEFGKKSPRRMLLTLGAAGIVLVVLAGLVAGGLVWHERPGFCAVCHTPMKNYVDGYKGGDKTLMITPHATGKTVLHTGDKTLTATLHATGNTVVSCLDCHKPTIRMQATVGFHWVTGNYEFPLKQRVLGTRSFCLSSGCHVEADIIKATKDYGGAASFNQHDPRHGKQECYRCHSMHGKSVLMCNQCHKLKLPDGWVSPATTGVVSAR